jgi:hypothetical protein
MVRLEHELPRRIRFSVPQLRGDRHGAAAFTARVRTIDGVAEADLIPLTGSLIVRHDGQPGTRERILHNLEEFTQAVTPQPAEALVAAGTAVAPAHSSHRIADMVADALAERLTERLVRVAVAALI